MSIGWTAPEDGIPPPTAVLSFYAPYDFLSGGKWDEISAWDRSGLSCC
jgi:hypothetical protein